jgi:Xaa-Pro aminopeptidase
MGVDVYDIDPKVAAQLTRRRSAAVAAWGLADEFVLIGAGEPIPVPGRYDLTYRFRAHSEYFHLTDRERPGGVLAFDPTDGWTEFAAPVTREELFWAGADELAEGVPNGTCPLTELTAWLDARRGRRCGCLGAIVPGITSEAGLDEELRYAHTQVRPQRASSMSESCGARLSRSSSAAPCRCSFHTGLGTWSALVSAMPEAFYAVAPTPARVSRGFVSICPSNPATR